MLNATLRDLAEHIERAAHDPAVCLGCLAMLLTDAIDELVEQHPELVEPAPGKRLDG
jgi:hypothetical protein